MQRELGSDLLQVFPFELGVLVSPAKPGFIRNTGTPRVKEQGTTLEKLKATFIRIHANQGPPALPAMWWYGSRLGRSPVTLKGTIHKSPTPTGEASLHQIWPQAWQFCILLVSTKFRSPKKGL